MPQTIDRRGVQRLLDGGAQLVEVLPGEQFERSHLPGAINIPLEDLVDVAGDRLDPARPVVAYCYDSL